MKILSTSVLNEPVILGNHSSVKFPYHLRIKTQKDRALSNPLCKCGAIRSKIENMLSNTLLVIDTKDQNTLVNIVFKEDNMDLNCSLFHISRKALLILSNALNKFLLSLELV